MERRLVIHGSTMSGYGTPGGLAALYILGGLGVWLSVIWSFRGEVVPLLIIVGVGTVVIVAVELIWRRNFVEVSGDRVRWFFRSRSDGGDEPVANLLRVEFRPSDGARLMFRDGMRLVSRVDFRGGDIKRLVATLGGLGVEVENL